MSRKEKYSRLIRFFLKTMTNPETELIYADGYQLLVAVILSAQCTDKRVNLITPAFFRRFPDVYALSKAGNDEVFSLIRSCSYPNAKTQHLVGMAKMLVEKFNSTVPSDINQLMQLPGVGRKTANVILSVIFNQPAFAVDTHVKRVAARIGLTPSSANVLKAEKILTQNFPSHLIPKAHHWLILHGRYVCKARNPDCAGCGINDICNYFKKRKK